MVVAQHPGISKSPGVNTKQTTPAPSRTRFDVSQLTRDQQLINDLSNRIQAYQEDANASRLELEHLLKQFSGDPLVKQLLDANRLVVTAAARGHWTLVSAIMRENGNVNVSDAAGNTALRHAVNQNNAPMTQSLLAHGANPDSKPKKSPEIAQFIQLGRNNAILASKQQNAAMLKSLLLNGAAPYIEKMSMTAPEEIRMLELLRMHMQLHEYTTRGMSTAEGLYVKQEIITALNPLVSPKQREALKKSLELDQALLRLPRDYKAQCIRNAISALTPGDFIWLKTGTSGHAINTVVRRNPDHGLDVSIANRGSGCQFHDPKPDLSVSVLTYRFQPEPGRTLSLNLHEFEAEVSRLMAYGLANTMTTPDFYRMWAAVQSYPHTLCINQPRPLPIEKRHDQSSYLDSQRNDNCVTMSMLAAVDHLFGNPSDPAHFQKLVMHYDQHLIRELGKLGFSPQDIHAIEQKQAANIDENLHFFRGLISFNKAILHDPADDCRKGHLLTAISEFEAAAASYQRSLITAPKSKTPAQESAIHARVDRLHFMENKTEHARVLLHRDFGMPLHLNANDYLSHLAQPDHPISY